MYMLMCILHINTSTNSLNACFLVYAGARATVVTIHLFRAGDTIMTLEASDREEMFTWLQELQTRRKDITQKRAAKLVSAL